MWLTELMRTSHVIRHYDVTGKICPNPYVMDEEKWIQFKAVIKRLAPLESGHEAGGSRS